MSEINRNIFSAILILLITIFGSCDRTYSSQRNSERPNIIFIFVDDMGYGDLPTYGNAGVQTPNIDQMAVEGIRFTNFYVNSPICSPSRVAVTTGQYPLRWNITSFLADSARNINRGMDHYLDPSAPSLARILQNEGYYTAHVGKWHLGGQREVEGAPLISEFGFNSTLTSFEGLGERLGIKFETKQWNGSNRFFHSVKQARLGRGKIRWVKRHKQPRIYVNRALKEIQKAREKEQPFYINLWTDAVHTPLEAPPELRGNGSIRANYFGVIIDLDNQIGRLLDYIRKEESLRNNTLVVFASDNGPSQEIGSTGGLRAHKGSLYEGGIREPFIVWAPRFIDDSRKGTVNNNTILAGMDLPPTLLSIAGVTSPDSITFDGLDMSEELLGKSEEQRSEPVMWVRPPDYNPNGHWKGLTTRKDLAIRDGKWKLLVETDGSEPELFNLLKNPGETINLAESHPGITENLKEKVLTWFEDTIAHSSAEAKYWGKE